DQLPQRADLPGPDPAGQGSATVSLCAEPQWLFDTGKLRERRADGRTVRAGRWAAALLFPETGSQAARRDCRGDGTSEVDADRTQITRRTATRRSPGRRRAIAGRQESCGRGSGGREPGSSAVPRRNRHVPGAPLARSDAEFAPTDP